jgi:hypothetical protein
MKAKKVNFRKEDDKPLVNVDVPTLVPSDKLSPWQEGDKAPYYKIQAINYPVKANGYNYTESFFESFVDKLKTNLIPGSRGGHETSWGKRAPTDLLLVGGKLSKNGDGSGTVYLKNYIPLNGESGDNSIFLKECKTGMIDFSLVSYTRDERIEKPDGSVDYNVIQSLYGERNDAVEYGTGAMEQKTNALDDIEAQSLRDLIDEKINAIQGEGMKKEEIFQGLTTLKENNEISLPEIAKHLNLSALVLTEEQKINLAAFDAVKKLCGDKSPVEVISGLLDEKKENAKAVRNAKLNEEFGLPEHPQTKKENKARIYAEKIIGNEELTAEKINAVKEDSIFKALAAENASVGSDFNTFGPVEGQKHNSGAPVVAEY